MGDSHRQHHSPGHDNLSAIQLQLKTIRQLLETGYELVLKLRQEAILERETKRREGLEFHGSPEVGVFNSAFSAKMF